MKLWLLDLNKKDDKEELKKLNEKHLEELKQMKIKYKKLKERMKQLEHILYH
jgi:uncharacterized protein YciI